MSLTLGPQIATLFILVFARVGTLVMLMPGLGERILPAVFACRSRCSSHSQ